MKHHFSDHLFRDLGHWEIVENRFRHAYSVSTLTSASDKISIVTISKHDQNWQLIHHLPDLRELTLHEPSSEQLASLPRLQALERLRITHARPKSLNVLAELPRVRELVLEYVSGFSDLSPVGAMPNLSSLHIENLRKVVDFSGLKAANNLKYLSIDGTLDWKQPVQNLNFLAGLKKLEVLFIHGVRFIDPQPSLKPLAKLKNLKSLLVNKRAFELAEYAYVQAHFPHLEDASFLPVERNCYVYSPLPDDDIRNRMPIKTLKENYPEVLVSEDGTLRQIPEPSYDCYHFLGKGTRSIRADSKLAQERVKAHEDKYSELLERAKQQVSAI